MAIHAVFFDVGGPLNTEVSHERLIDGHIRSALAAEGIEVDDVAYAAASQWAVECFAPNAYQAIVWRLSSADARVAERVYRVVWERATTLDAFELRPGIAELLFRLKQRGLKLGLAANQPATTIPVLDAAGVGRFFDSREVSETLKLRKPDPRFFLKLCEQLNVRPSESIMVGDRIDNDVVPARSIGMRTILLRTGRHIDQQPRTWEEAPDVEVRDVRGIEAAIGYLVRQASVPPRQAPTIFQLAPGTPSPRRRRR
ncbi:MAG: putative hydrolase of the superfamily [Chloroflexota bacterium]|nr:putative hydrolase of the superfamily [Chloroflexota bacterium]